MSERHDLLGPSSLMRRAMCPGSYAAEKELPPQDEMIDPESPAARGKARHEAAAAGLIEPHRRNELLENLPENDRHVITAWWDFWGREYKTAKEIYNADEILFFVEHETTTQDGRICTLDAALVVPGQIAIVADLKNGNPGWVRYNLQIADYAGAVRRDYGVKNITVAIVHRHRIDVWLYEEGELDARLRQIAHIREDAQKPDAERRPGRWCEYCRAQYNCPARMALAAEVNVMMSPVDVFRALDEGARRELYEKIKVAQKRLAEVKEQIDSLVIDGALNIDGYEVGPGRSTREWKNEREALVVLTGLATQKGISSEGLIKIISPAAAEKLLGDKKAIAQLCEAKAGKPTVRRLTD